MVTKILNTNYFELYTISMKQAGVMFHSGLLSLYMEVLDMSVLMVGSSQVYDVFFGCFFHCTAPPVKTGNEVYTIIVRPPGKLPGGLFSYWRDLC